MALINFSVKHGQTLDVARTNFEKAIGDAQSKFGMWIHRVDWSADRTSATLGGPGYEVKLWYDAQDVHATGDIPIFASLLKRPLEKFLEQTFQKQIPKG